ncbi:hypothetical protein KP509_09G083800 [Ceratopteris richardii]|uniref:RING-type domain-containing protein n=1 Tax=Ceratopteris richardii TaxID=49495 RepID=A0A8T2UCA0_CERRI|nr:hypothetical protein KP509_09G083800 [Ceratopteris richardii]
MALHSPFPPFLLIALIPVAALINLFIAIRSIFFLSSDDDDDGGRAEERFIPPVSCDFPFDSPLNPRMLERSLPSVPYVSLAVDKLSGDARSPACVVCLEEILCQEEVCFLPACGHVFHAVCIRSWIRCSCRGNGGLLPTCPLCRVSLDLGSDDEDSCTACPLFWHTFS